MDLVKKRKMIEVLRGLIGAGFSGGQADLAQYLKKKGFDVTQSTVSRALTKIGAFKVKSNGKTVYTLSAPTKPPQFSGQSLSHLVMKVEHNETTIVVRTNPGSAMFVAGYIDHHCEDFCLGTVAGDDTILVIPKSCKKMKSNTKQLNEFFMSKV